MWFFGEVAPDPGTEKLGSRIERWVKVSVEFAAGEQKGEELASIVMMMMMMMMMMTIIILLQQWISCRDEDSIRQPFLLHTQHPRPSSARSCAGSGGREPHPLRLHPFDFACHQQYYWCIPMTILWTATSRWWLILRCRFVDVRYMYCNYCNLMYFADHSRCWSPQGSGFHGSEDDPSPMIGVDAYGFSMAFVLRNSLSAVEPQNT